MWVSLGFGLHFSGEYAAKLAACVPGISAASPGGSGKWVPIVASAVIPWNCTILALLPVKEKKEILTVCPPFILWKPWVQEECPEFEESSYISHQLYTEPFLWYNLPFYFNQICSLPWIAESPGVFQRSVPQIPRCVAAQILLVSVVWPWFQQDLGTISQSSSISRSCFWAAVN